MKLVQDKWKWRGHLAWQIQWKVISCIAAYGAKSSECMVYQRVVDGVVVIIIAASISRVVVVVVAVVVAASTAIITAAYQNRPF